MIITEKNAFLDQAKLKKELVDIGDGHQVFITELEATTFYPIWLDPEYAAEGGGGAVDLRKIIPALLARSIVDEEGNRLFADEDAADLAKISPSTYFPLSEAVRRLNGISGVEAKNSEASPEDGSSSGSQSN